jgi:excisionase family DNA binding protein
MKVLLADEVAELLRVPVPRIYELARQGQIPHMRLGRQVRFRQEAVEAWLNTVEDSQEKISLHAAWPKAVIA